jgi:hypothetical protein
MGQSEESSLPIVISASDITDPAVGSVRNPVQRYTAVLADKVVDLYFAGKSLHAISAEEGMPCYATLLRWYAQNAEFRAKMDEAETARAMHHRDQAMEIALSPAGKDEVPAARLGFDAHVWAAEKADPKKFGKQTNQNTQISGGVTINVVTNVPERDEKRVIELNEDGTIKNGDADGNIEEL